MWPFKKPKLNGNLIFLVAYRNSDYEMDISKEFAKTLTRKQIKMLNETCDIRREDLRCDAELLMEQGKQAERDRIKKAAKEKRTYHFVAELDHNLNGDEYQQYFNNNLDKTVLTEDEEKRLMKMLSGFNKKEAEIHERLDELEGKSAKKDE